MNTATHRNPSVLFLFLVLIVAPPVTHGQNLPTKNDGELKILTVTVRNKAGDFVMNLPRESFTLTDEKESRPIEFFENTDGPMSVGLLVDTSGSMQIYETKDIARANAIGETLSRFVELSNPGNEYFVLAFDDAPRVLTDWQSSAELHSGKISLNPQKRNTSFYDACQVGLEKFAFAHFGKRALIVFTDGLDNSSKSTFVQVRERLKKADVLFYAVGIATPGDVGSALGIEGTGILSELAGITGGEVVTPHNRKEMDLAIEALTIELRHQYRLGFYAPNTGAARWRRIKLKITPREAAPAEFKKLSIRSKQGYYSK